MNRISVCLVLPFFALLLASCSAPSASLLSGEMHLISVSGSGCLNDDMAGKQLSLDVAFKQDNTSAVPTIDGYFSGPDIQSGHFFGNDLNRLQVVYPDEAGVAQGHTLALAITPDGVSGELHENPRSDSANCYFEKASIVLKQKGTGSEAAARFDQQSSLFRAEAYFASGQLLLNSNKPEEAIDDFTRSLKLRNKVNPNDPVRAYPVVSGAVADIMAGREKEALASVRELLAEHHVSDDADKQQRIAVSAALCNDGQTLDSSEGQQATIRLMDAVSDEFGKLDGMALPLAACYFGMGKERKEQEDPDTAQELFRKAFQLNPGNPESIAGVIMSLIDKQEPAEGEKYLTEHAEAFLEKAGKEQYSLLLSYLFIAEAQEAGNSGDLARAEKLCHDAVKARPNDPTFIIALSRVLGREGKFTEAKRTLNDGVKECDSELCRKEYADETERQDLIARMVTRLEASSGKR